MKPSHYSKGEYPATKRSNSNAPKIAIGIALSCGFAAAVYGGISYMNQRSAERNELFDQAYREYYAAVDTYTELSSTDYNGGILQFNGPNSTSLESEIAPVVYDFAQRLALVQFSEFRYNTGVFNSSAAGAGGLTSVSFNTIAPDELMEITEASCELATNISAHYEQNPTQYPFESENNAAAQHFLSSHCD
jgi:hypothetical protein